MKNYRKEAVELVKEVISLELLDEQMWYWESEDFDGSEEELTLLQEEIKKVLSSIT